jgi:hypothetical protein
MKLDNGFIKNICSGTWKALWWSFVICNLFNKFDDYKGVLTMMTIMLYVIFDLKFDIQFLKHCEKCNINQ